MNGRYLIASVLIGLVVADTGNSFAQEPKAAAKASPTVNDAPAASRSATVLEDREVVPFTVLMQQMASKREDFDPTPLHARGVDGLKEVLTFLSGTYPRERSISGSLSALLGYSYGPGFATYAKGINDYERILLLSEHVAEHLRDGNPHYLGAAFRDKAEILGACLETLRRNDQDKNCLAYAKKLAPCLEHANGQSGEWLIKGLDEHGNGHPFIAYALMAESLKSKHPKLVELAVHNGTEVARVNLLREQAHENLLLVFNGSSTEPNKFSACFALMHQFKHQPAIDYLLTQTRSPDRERSHCAIQWLGDTCNWGTKEYPALLEAFDPLLKSADAQTRSLATDSIATYSGPQTTDRLLRSLSDSHTGVVEVARRELLRRATALSGPMNEPNLLSELKETAESSLSSSARVEAAAILKKAYDVIEMRQSER